MHKLYIETIYELSKVDVFILEENNTCVIDYTLEFRITEKIYDGEKDYQQQKL